MPPSSVLVRDFVRRQTTPYLQAVGPYTRWRMIGSGGRGTGVVGRRRSTTAYGRFLPRPYAAAGKPWEPAIAAACSLLLGVLFVVEIATPETVVAALAVLPLIAASWLLSDGAAAAVFLIAITLFGAEALMETAGRPTIVIAGFATVAVATLTRLYANSLASLLFGRAEAGVPWRHQLVTLDGMDRPWHGISSLTRRELEVARLAVEGRTAAEIGMQLHIGERTVESHLASTYSKLRINSRSKLIRMASKLPDTVPGAVTRQAAPTGGRHGD